jgi:hypothetical protein
VARTAQEVQTDLDRIDVMVADAGATGNEYTVNQLMHARRPLEKELEPLVKPSKTTKLSQIDDASAAMLDYSNEANVSKDLKDLLVKYTDALVGVRTRTETPPEGLITN